MTPMRIAIVGLGRHAERTVLPAMGSAENAEIAGVVSRDAQRRSDIGDRFDCPHAPSLEALCALVDVDAVYITSDNASHVSLAGEAIALGLHVLCEKPLAPSLAETERLVEETAAADLRIAEAAAFLDHPQYTLLEEIVRDGVLGEIRSITARFGFPHLDVTNFRYDPLRGGGALSDAGFYPVAAAVSLLGDDLAVLGAVLDDDEERGVDLGGSALVRGQFGATGLLDWGFGRAYSNEIRVWGSKRWALLDRAFSKPPSLATVIVVGASDGTTQEFGADPADHFAAFIDRICADPDAETRSLVARSRVMDAIRSVAADAALEPAQG